VIATMLSLTIIGAAFLLWFVLVFLFTPHIRYRVAARLDAGSGHFQHVLHSTLQAAVHHRNRVEILTNGSAFYPAMLDAIRGARRSIDMECYIFQPGRAGNQFIEALAERAESGVTVTIVVDAIGSSRLSGSSLARLRDAGCQVESYQPLRWYSLARINNRTHRELLIVDGDVAFIGGAGIADWWHEPADGARAWRDTVARVEGPVVAALQGVFVENWLECCGEILCGGASFPHLEPRGDTTAFVVKSSPSDRATASRVAFQLLIEAAQKEVWISTPYFLPDKTLRRALVQTVARGVRVTVVVPGRETDQKWVRFASRRMFGELLEGGLAIYEYHGMTHCKALIVDGLWSMIGTTNIDNRSFEHNDEVNLVMRDTGVAERLLVDFARDVADSVEVTLETWRGSPWWERLVRPVAWILERQQ
jgi:cardiolipin synthase A/B